MATSVQKVTLYNLGTARDVYVGHVATSGWLTQLEAITDDSNMHPTWPAVEAGATYIGEPDKDPGPPVQYGWDSIKNVYWHGMGGGGTGYSAQTAAQTNWATSQFGWTQHKLSVEDNGDFFKDVTVPFTFYYMLAAQTGDMVFLFHVATVGIGGQEPTNPPGADSHQHLHFLGSAPTISALPNRVYLYAFGFKTGYFSFEVTQGTDKVDLIDAYTGVRSPNDKVEYNILTAGNFVKVIVEAVAATTAINDVTISVRWGEVQARAVDIIGYKTTVWTPTMGFISMYDYQWNGGYRTIYKYKVVPKLLSSENIPKAIYKYFPVNESFSGHWDDSRWTPPGVVNWAITTGNTATDQDAFFFDNLGMANIGPPQNPTPVGPVNMTPVTGYDSQIWRGGSGVSGDGVELEPSKRFSLCLGAGRRQ